jgi:hypothetical protein
VDGDCVVTSTGSGIRARASTMYSAWFSEDTRITFEPSSASLAHEASGVRPACAFSAAWPSQREPSDESLEFRSWSTWVSSSDRLFQYWVWGSDAAGPGPSLIMSYSSG